MIISKTLWFLQEWVLIQNWNFKIKTHKKLLLKFKNPKLFTKNDIQTYRNQIWIKINHKTSTHDNIFWMNMNPKFV
jgi:hypothetical protein